MKPKLPTNIKQINKPLWVNVEQARYYGISDELFQYKAFTYKDSTKEINGKKYLNINDLEFMNVEVNPKRKYWFMRMYDYIYFELDKYLNDSQKAKIIHALSNVGTVDSWANLFSTYDYALNERAYHFIKWGNLILQTKSLYKNFDKRW